MASMFILLPDDLEGIYGLEAGLHDVDLASTLGNMQSEELNVTLPKFKKETSLDLKSNLMEVRTLLQLLQCIGNRTSHSYYDIMSSLLPLCTWSDAGQKQNRKNELLTEAA